MNITIDTLVGMTKDYASQGYDLAHEYASLAYDYSSKNPYVAAGTAVGLAALIALSSYLREHPDVKTMRKLAREIIALPPTIGDGASYKFLKTRGSYVNDHNTKKGSNAMLASGMRTAANGKAQKRTPEEILRLGKDLLTKKSGQCDHMAAAVIAKVVEHIRKGGKWSSKIELVGNGGHAFVIMNRRGSLDNPGCWCKAVIVDTWLGALGVHPEYANELTSGDYGVISGRRNVLKHAEFFQPDEVTHQFTVKELHSLAGKK